MAGIYKITAALQGHEDDVRGVIFPSPYFVTSVSRDATVRLWKREDSEATTFTEHINSTGSGFINSVTFILPTEEHPKGLIVSGGQDTIIEVREPESKGTDDAKHLLLGHTHNVCALDNYAGIIISGSWDGTARVWKNWESQYILDGHDQGVLAVLVLSETDVVTGSADKTIRIWRNGKVIKKIEGHTDCVRGLCRMPNGGFASCGNDGTVRIWSSDGDQLQELHGHTAFIYSVAALPSGELVSAGEDRTVRVWRDGDCVQTITHPAISVWSVAVCSQNGDIVTGASDRIVRVFSREKKRWADEEALQAFDNSVAASSIPSAQVGDVKKADLPDASALKTPGRKDGQVIMVRNDNTGAVEAWVWSQEARSWSNVGTVVDAVGSNRKQMFEGKEYDYVFDVDIQEGAPALKLPYNASENPFEAARRFLEANELPISYLDTVGQFIVKNAGGVSLGTQERPAGSDPWGMENRYRPDAPPPQQAKPKRIPQKSYLSITAASLPTIQNKVNELNKELLDKGEKGVALNPDEASALAKLCGSLQAVASPSYKAGTHNASFSGGLELISKIITSWQPQSRLPGLDLLRLVAAATPLAATYEPMNGLKIGDILETSGAFDISHPNNVMLATRTFVNLFQTEEGRDYMNSRFEQIIQLVEKASAGTTNRNLKIAKATLLLNYAVLITSEGAIDRAITIFEPLINIAKNEIDSETTFRALVGLGTLLTLQKEVREAALSVYDIRQSVTEAEVRVKEPRIKDLATDIRGLL
ncbi:PFU-domain-containing protein [Choiromyces venosus 120613-1]|uniref:PFU-domain-containing protein n=1 Tax=Choiromyces venosus 120613-1 TaxID=1336337 RepID=A0A3N4KH98_9PEZI|nr:PFU-domain-containing protein [Choiromyces venosus 120613-1]